MLRMQMESELYLHCLEDCWQTTVQKILDKHPEIIPALVMNTLSLLLSKFGIRPSKRCDDILTCTISPTL